MKHGRVFLIAAVLVASGAVFSTVMPVRAFTVAMIDYPGANETYAYDINDVSEVVGAYMDADSFYIHGFRYTTGGYQTIDYPGAPHQYALGLSNSGRVVGYFKDPDSGYYYSYSTYDGVNFTIINYPGYKFPDEGWTYAYGANDAGYTVGFYNVWDGFTLEFISHGFIYSSGIFTTFDYPGAKHTVLMDINESGVIAGACDFGSGYHAFIYDQGTFYLGPVETSLFGVNDDLQMIGFLFEIGRTFFYDQPFGWLFPPRVSARKVNNNLEVVGTYTDVIGGIHGFVLSWLD